MLHVQTFTLVASVRNYIRGNKFGFLQNFALTVCRSIPFFHYPLHLVKNFLSEIFYPQMNFSKANFSVTELYRKNLTHRAWKVRHFLNSLKNLFKKKLPALQQGFFKRFGPLLFPVVSWQSPPTFRPFFCGRSLPKEVSFSLICALSLLVYCTLYLSFRTI